jgi:ABC-type multidrug transport system ATPase subunit
MVIRETDGKSHRGAGMPAVIVADTLVKTYGKTRALDGFSLAVPEGIAVGLLGPNGAGKTSAVQHGPGLPYHSRAMVNAMLREGRRQKTISHQLGPAMLPEYPHRGGQR